MKKCFLTILMAGLVAACASPVVLKLSHKASKKPLETVACLAPETTTETLPTWDYTVWARQGTLNVSPMLWPAY